MLFLSIWVTFVGFLVVFRVVYSGETGLQRKLIEDVAEGYANREELPELVYWVCRLARVRGCSESEVAVEATDAQETGTKGRALLVEGGGLVSSFVEEGVVGDGGLDD